MKIFYTYVHIVLITLLITGCSDDDSTKNPGFVQLETVNGQTQSLYNENFNNRPVDIYSEPIPAEDNRIVKINTESKKSGSIVVKDGSGVGYIYEDGKKTEVIVTSDEEGQLWAIDEQGNSYPVDVDKGKKKKN